MSKVRARVLAPFIAIWISACGGGGGGGGAEGGSTSPVPTAAAPAANVVASPSTVVAGVEQASQLVPKLDSNGAQTLVSGPGSTIAPSLKTGAPIIITGGTNSQLPLGLAGVVDSATANADGSTSVLVRPAKLADVLTKIDIGSAPISLDSSNFVGVIAPVSVKPSAAGRATAQSATGLDRVELGGAVIISDSNRIVRALSATNAAGSTNSVSLNAVVKLSEMGLDPATFRPYGSGRDASFNITGSINNLKLKHNINYEKILGVPIGLKSMHMEVTGDTSLEIKLEGGFHADFGYFSQAWKEVEDSHFKMLGISGKITGLDSRSKIGRFPLVGLVWKVANFSPIPVQYFGEQTQSALRSASAGGIIVWVYITAKGTIEIDGAVGARINGGSLRLGMNMPEGGSVTTSQGLVGGVAGSRLIEAPFLDGSANLNVRFGPSFDLDVFVLGVHIGNVAADFNFVGALAVDGTWSWGTSALGDPWSAQGSACVTRNFGAGLIISAGLSLGAEVSTSWKKLSTNFDYSFQLPTDDVLLTPGWHGFGNNTWYTDSVQRSCYPTPTVLDATVNSQSPLVAITIDGVSFPDDVDLAIAPARACIGVRKTLGSASRAVFECDRQGVQGFNASIVSAKAQNLDASAVLLKLRVATNTLPLAPISFTLLTPASQVSVSVPANAIFTAVGQNFSNISRINFSWSGASGIGTTSWLKGDAAWQSGIASLTDTKVVFAKKVLAENGAVAGTTDWVISFSDSDGNIVSKPFSVKYSPSSAPFVVTGLSSSDFSSPTLPLDGSIVVSGTGLTTIAQITFSWNGVSGVGASSWVKGDSGWASGVSGISGSSLTVKRRLLLPSGEAPGKTSWTLTFKDAVGNEVAKPFAVTYTAAQGSLLSAPTLSAPAAGATGVATTPTLSWSGVSGANRYWLTVATSAAALPTDPAATSCPTCIVTGNTTATSHTLPNAFPNGGTTATLAAGRTYYWKVQGYNTAGTQGAYSATGSFTTR